MKSKFVSLLLIAMLLIPVSMVQAKSVVKVLDSDKLYAPDIYGEYLADELDASGFTADAMGLDEVTPYWADMVNQELVSNDGEGVYVAVLDTGLLDLWPFFFDGANIATGLGKGFTHDVWWDDTIGDFVFGDLRDDRGFITDAYMGSGHGTHVTSTIVGYNYNDSFWVKGIAPHATIIPVLVLDAWEVPYPGGTAQFTGGTDEMVSAGLRYVADLAETLDGPVVINMSLGGGYSTMIADAVNYAISKGVIVVASAGNSGYDGMGYPGALPQVISVANGGWTEQWLTYPARWWLNDVPEEFNTQDYFGNNSQLYLDYSSSRPNKALGQKNKDLDVTAPGSAIVGPYKNYFSTTVGYYYLWGTSMASPHVAAMAGLVLQSHPDLSQSKMEFILKTAATGLPLPADGSLLYDVPWVFWDFAWFGGDAGSGFLQADTALYFADKLAK